MANILQISNYPLKNENVDCATGYTTIFGAYTRYLSKNNSVKNISMVQEALNNFPDFYNKNNEALWEIQFLDDYKLGEYLIAEYGNKDIIIIHDSLLLPINFSKHLISTGAKVIRLVHDPSFIDPLYGMLGGRLRTDWTDIDSTLHAERVHTKCKSMLDNDKLQVLNLKKFREAAFNQLFSASLVIFPTIQLQHLFQVNMGLTGIKNKVLPHYIPDINVTSEITEDSFQNRKEVLLVAAWPKIDMITALSVVLLKPEINFVLFIDTIRVFSHFKKWFDLTGGVPSNLKILDTVSTNEYLTYCNDNVKCCFHPTIIFETFGLLPFELAKLGIPTILKDKMFSGISNYYSILPNSNYRYLDNPIAAINYCMQDKNYCSICKELQEKAKFFLKEEDYFSQLDKLIQ